MTSQYVGPLLPHRSQKWGEDFQIIALCTLLKILPLLLPFFKESKKKDIGASYLRKDRCHFVGCLVL